MEYKAAKLASLGLDELQTEHLKGAGLLLLFMLYDKNCLLNSHPSFVC